MAPAPHVHLSKGETVIGASSNADNRAVVRNAAAQYGSVILNLGLGLVLTPTLLRGLGVTGFGYYTAAVALTGYIGLGELGIGTATVRRIASELARDDEAAVSRVVSTARSIYLATATAAAILTVVLTLLAGQLLDAPPDMLRQLQVALVLLGSAYTFSFVLTIYQALMIGAGRSDLLTLAGGLISGLTSVAQIGTVLLTHDLRAVAAVTAISSLVAALVNRHLAMRRFPTLRGRLLDANWRTARELLGSGWRNAVITIGALAAYNADVLIVGAFLSVGAVAAYGVATRAAGLMSSVTFRLSEVLVPAYSHHDATGNSTRLRDIYLESTLASAAIALPSCAALIAFGDPLLGLWLGDTPAGAADVLAILALALFIAVPGGTAFFLLSGIDELRFAVKASVFGGLSNAGLGIVLTPVIGLTGPALATLILRSTFDLVVLPIHVCRTLNTSAKAWWRSLSSVLWLSVVSTSVTALILRSLVGEGPLWQVLLSCLLIVSVHVLAFAIGAGTQRRQRYANLLRRNSSTDDSQERMPTT